MKSNPSLHPTSGRLLRLFAMLALGLALLVAGCATDGQVRSIITTYNAAMISSQLGDLAPKAGNTPNWQAANAQIEAFIAAHPDQKEATAPLRVRQAMLLLANGQLNLARAAFDSVSKDDLCTKRDEALKAQQVHLLWWYGASNLPSWSATDYASAAQARASLLAAYADLGSSPEIRDFLAEMCAWIGLTTARRATTDKTGLPLFEEALNDYARIFTKDDKKLLSAGVSKLTDLKALTSDIRRCIRAEIVLSEARALKQECSFNAHLAEPTFQQLLDTPAP